MTRVSFFNNPYFSWLPGSPDKAAFRERRLRSSPRDLSRWDLLDLIGSEPERVITRRKKFNWFSNIRLLPKSRQRRPFQRLEDISTQWVYIDENDTTATQVIHARSIPEWLRTDHHTMAGPSLVPDFSLPHVLIPQLSRTSSISFNLHSETPLQGRWSSATPSVSSLEDMAEASRLRFEVSGEQDDFESSLDYIVRARTELQKSSDEEDLVETLARLYHKEGLAHLAWYQRIGDIANIANAVQSWKNAVDLTPADIYHRHDKIKYLTSLADACQARFAELGEIEDADDAVATLRQVVQLTPDGSSDKPKLLKKHGRALQTRFERFGEMADLTKAISSYKRASELGI